MDDDRVPDDEELRAKAERDRERAMAAAAGKPPAPVAPTPAKPAKAKPLPSTSPGNRPDRSGKVLISGYFDAELRRRLKRAAVDDDKTLAQVMAEAFEMYLKARQT